MLRGLRLGFLTIALVAACSAGPQAKVICAGSQFDPDDWIDAAEKSHGTFSDVDRDPLRVVAPPEGIESPPSQPTL